MAGPTWLTINTGKAQTVSKVDVVWMPRPNHPETRKEFHALSLRQRWAIRLRNLADKLDGRLSVAYEIRTPKAMNFTGRDLTEAIIHGVGATTKYVIDLEIERQVK